MNKIISITILLVMGCTSVLSLFERDSAMTYLSIRARKEDSKKDDSVDNLHDLLSLGVAILSEQIIRSINILKGVALALALLFL